MPQIKNTSEVKEKLNKLKYLYPSYDGQLLFRAKSWNIAKIDIWILWYLNDFTFSKVQKILELS